MQEHDLALGVAAGNRDHRCAQVLTAVVHAQPTGKQAIAVGVVDNLTRSHACTYERSGNDLTPDINIISGIGDNLGLALGAR